MSLVHVISLTFKTKLQSKYLDKSSFSDNIEATVIEWKSHKCKWKFWAMFSFSLLALAVPKTARWLRLTSALLFQHCKTFVQFTYKSIRQKQVYKEGCEPIEGMIFLNKGLSNLIMEMWQLKLAVILKEIHHEQLAVNPHKSCVSLVLYCR